MARVDLGIDTSQRRLPGTQHKTKPVFPIRLGLALCGLLLFCWWGRDWMPTPSQHNAPFYMQRAFRDPWSNLMVLSVYAVLAVPVVVLGFVWRRAGGGFWLGEALILLAIILGLAFGYSGLVFYG